MQLLLSQLLAQLELSTLKLGLRRERGMMHTVLLLLHFQLQLQLLLLALLLQSVHVCRLRRQGCNARHSGDADPD